MVAAARRLKAGLLCLRRGVIPDGAISHSNPDDAWWVGGAIVNSVAAASQWVAHHGRDGGTLLVPAGVVLMYV
eukprot:8021003-Pyramimonas_sp.AAC.1